MEMGVILSGRANVMLIFKIRCIHNTTFMDDVIVITTVLELEQLIFLRSLDSLSFGTVCCSIRGQHGSEKTVTDSGRQQTSNWNIISFSLPPQTGQWECHCYINLKAVCDSRCTYIVTNEACTRAGQVRASQRAGIVNTEAALQ